MKKIISFVSIASIIICIVACLVFFYVAKSKFPGLYNTYYPIIMGYWQKLLEMIPPFIRPRLEGELCGLGKCLGCVGHLDCKGHKPGQDSLACDNSKCTKQLRDWAGVWYTPSECRDAPAPLGYAGSCRDRGHSWKRKAGQSCDTHVACEGHMPGQNTLACDNGTCKPQLRDWAGVWYTPSECRDAPAPLGYAGSCRDRGHNWPRKEGQSCDNNSNCEGHMPGQNTLACDNGTCRRQLRDWAGVYYNASECRDAPAPLGYAGSCRDRGHNWPRKDGQSCDTNVACEGGCCNNGRCEGKKRDWAGVWYCSWECRGAWNKGAGTC
jgi:hypothetical protein